MNHMPHGVGMASADCTSPALTSAGPATGGEGRATLLTLDGFSGPLDHLLALGRAQTIDLAAVSLTALLDQLTTALCQAPSSIPLGQKGDWVVRPPRSGANIPDGGEHNVSPWAGQV